MAKGVPGLRTPVPLQVAETAVIRQWIEQIIAGDFDLPVDDAFGSQPMKEIADVLDRLANKIDEQYIPRREVDERLEDFIDTIVSIASQDFCHKLPDNHGKDMFETVAAGLNLLGEELLVSDYAAKNVQSILASMGDMLIVLDAAANITMVNQATINILGFEESDLIAQKATLIFEDEKLLSRLLHWLELQNLVCGLETNLRTQSGEMLPILFSVATLKNQEQNEGIICVATDITERKKVQEAFASLQAKNKLMTTLSHELRTPLHAIMGYADLLQTGEKGPVTREQEKTLSRIVINAEKLHSLITDMLNQAMIESPQVKINVSEFAPQELLADIETVFGEQAEAKRLDFKFDIAVDMPDKLHGDVNRLHDILRNLVSNAIKFTDEGFIEIRLSRPAPEYWVFQVIDTGRGIPPAHMNRIFDAFNRGDDPIMRQHNGTGLGLTIVKDLVDLMGGYITVDSKLGYGTIFTVMFPIKT